MSGLALGPSAMEIVPPGVLQDLGMMKQLAVGVIALFGFLNRFNDTMATPLEAEPIEVGEKHLAKSGWSAGRHRRSSMK